MKRWPCWLYCFVVFVIAIIILHDERAYSQSSQGSLQKPRVAIKRSLIGDGIKKHLCEYIKLQIILAEMEASIKATRKFEVLTRQRAALSAVREEQEFAKSDFAKGDAAREGLLENANYLIIPTVQDFKFYRSIKPVPNISNKYLRHDSGILEINAQVLDTESGRIKTTFYLKSSFRTKDEVVNNEHGAPSSVHFSNMAKKVAAQMADQLVDAVFPMLVINVDGNQVWINRGKDGGLKSGEILNIYKPGKELVDPYTGEKLGSAEKFIGKIKVVRVNPKFTIAKSITEGLMKAMDVGCIIRKP